MERGAGGRARQAAAELIGARAATTIQYEWTQVRKPRKKIIIAKIKRNGWDVGVSPKPPHQETRQGITAHDGGKIMQTQIAAGQGKTQGERGGGERRWAFARSTSQWPASARDASLLDQVVVDDSVRVAALPACAHAFHLPAAWPERAPEPPVFWAGSRCLPPAAIFSPSGLALAGRARRIHRCGCLHLVWVCSLLLARAGEALVAGLLASFFSCVFSCVLWACVACEAVICQVSWHWQTDRRTVQRAWVHGVDHLCHEKYRYLI
jgi:hypothetical protein